MSLLKLCASLPEYSQILRHIDLCGSTFMGMTKRNVVKRKIFLFFSVFFSNGCRCDEQRLKAWNYMQKHYICKTMVHFQYTASIVFIIKKKNNNKKRVKKALPNVKNSIRGRKFLISFNGTANSLSFILIHVRSLVRSIAESTSRWVRKCCLLLSRNIYKII